MLKNRKAYIVHVAQVEQKRVRILGNLDIFRCLKEIMRYAKETET